MLPGVSAKDCLYADLLIDPSNPGCVTYEASDFDSFPSRMCWCRRFSTSRDLMLALSPLSCWSLSNIFARTPSLTLSWTGSNANMA